MASADHRIDHKLAIWVALRGPAVLIGSLHSHLSAPLTVAVELEVTAVQFEKAVDCFAEVILTDAAAAASSVSVLPLRLVVVTPARKRGGEDVTTRWTMQR